MATRDNSVLRREWRKYFPNHIWHQVLELDREHKRICEQFVDIVRQLAFVNPNRRRDAEDEIDEELDELYDEWRRVAPVELQLERGVGILEHMWENRYDYCRMWAYNVEERLRRMRRATQQGRR
jgi:hypothetical protein